MTGVARNNAIRQAEKLPIVAEMTATGFFVPLKQTFFEKQLL